MWRRGLQYKFLVGDRVALNCALYINYILYIVECYLAAINAEYSVTCLNYLRMTSYR